MILPMIATTIAPIATTYARFTALVVRKFELAGDDADTNSITTITPKIPLASTFTEIAIIVSP